MLVVLLKILLLVEFCGLQYLMVNGSLLEHGNDEVVYEDLSIFNGIPSCDSNCSYISSRNRKHMTCLIKDCNYSMTAEQNYSVRPRIFDISFVKFQDIDGRQKLALNLKWSPPYFGILRHTNGYLLNITDGITNYIRCYRIYESMDYHSNKKDIFENSCYGKYSNTFVRYGSTINVSISSLPLNKNNLAYTRTDAVVQVPNDDVTPTIKQCASNCNTLATSVSDEKTHEIQCVHIDANRVSSCAKKSKSLGNAPESVENTKGWYKYKDLEDKNNIKLALNFSWTFGIEYNMSDFGYFIEVKNKNKMEKHDKNSSYTKCFSMAHTRKLLGYKMKPTFFFDCYGRDSGTYVKPGEMYKVRVHSLPGLSSLKFHINIPDCDDPHMFDVSDCQGGENVLNGASKLHCENRSVEFSYKVSHHYGNRAIIVFCQEYEQHTACNNIYQYFTDLEPCGVLYNLSLNLSLPCHIKLMGNKNGNAVHDTIINFYDCTIHASSKSSNENIVWPLVISLVFVGFLVVSFIILRLRIRRRILKKSHGCNTNDNNNVDALQMIMPDTEEENMEQQPCMLQQKYKIFVMSSLNWDTHNKVVSSFCTFLKATLGLDVDTALWHSREIAEYPDRYFIENLNRASKVIILCSKENKNCLGNDDICGCRFCSIVKHICSLAFGKDTGKFLVAHYSSEEHIPVRLNKMNFPIFKLMEEFERLYFYLIDTEQYQHNGRKIYIEEVTSQGIYKTKHGKDLCEAITRQQNAEIEELPESVNVFVVTAIDCKAHRRVVSDFCSLLKGDLGLEVDTPIWDDTNIVAENPFDYLIEKINKAQKVIILCSKTHNTSRLNNEDICNSMFCRIITFISNLAFGDVTGKFLVAYFDYSSEHDIPEIISKLSLPTFKLIDEFEPLYFNLIETEQYQKGMKINVEQILPHEIYNSMHGKKLFESITKMIKSPAEDKEQLDVCTPLLS
ncbi:uncharacterized protein LOC120326136 isoform X1 [Styela clava]